MDFPDLEWKEDLHKFSHLRLKTICKSVIISKCGPNLLLLPQQPAKTSQMSDPPHLEITCKRKKEQKERTFDQCAIDLQYI
jgi:hypothetical protein